MAEFDFILAPDDQARLIDFLLRSGAAMVPSIAYPSATHKTITDVESAQRLIHENELIGPFFVDWPDWKSFPYMYSEIVKEGFIKFFLKQRHGGPYMDFLPCWIEKDQNRQIITSGFVGYYSKYWIEELGAEIPAPKDLKRRYATTTAYLRSFCKKANARSRIYWIGESALALIDCGVRPAVDDLDLLR